jgi:hypothetical protein
LHNALTVAVEDLTIDKVGQGREPDMRVGTRVEPFARLKRHGSESIEEDEWPDHAAMHGWQRPADLKAIAEIADGRQDDLFDFGGIGLNGHGFISSSSDALCEEIKSDFTCLENLHNLNRNVRGNRYAFRSRDPDA